MKKLFRFWNKVLLISFGLIIFGVTTTSLLAQDKVKKYEDQKNVKKLISVLHNKKSDIKTKTKVIEALGRLKDPASFETLIDVFENERMNIKLRWASINSLGMLKDKRAVEPIIKALNNKNLKIKALNALGEIGGQRALDALLSQLMTESSSSSKIVATALKKLNWIPANEEEMAFYAVADQDWDKAVNLGEVSITPLLKTLNDGHSNNKIKAMKTLDRMNWEVDEVNELAYKAAKALETELEIYRLRIIVGEMKLWNEAKLNLQKLEELKIANDSLLNETEYNFVKQRLLAEIDKEEKEVDKFREIVKEFKLTITKAGDRTYIGIESDQEGIMTFKVKRLGSSSLITGGVWYSLWTGEPSKESEWKGATVNLYRYNYDGLKYLYAKLYFSFGRRDLSKIEFLDASENPTEIVFWGIEAHTKIWVGGDRWIKVPVEMQWTKERLKWVMAEQFAQPRSHLK